MRQHSDRSQAAILREAVALTARFGTRLVIEELRCRDWASLTLTGARHELDVRLGGPHHYGACLHLQEHLPMATITIPGRILAEIVVEPGTADNNGMALTICALVIDE
jgi:hypothetical protein